MQQSLSLLSSQMRELITENKLDGIEEVAFARTISSNNNIMRWIEWINDSLLPVAFKALNNNLLLT